MKTDREATGAIGSSEQSSLCSEQDGPIGPLRSIRETNQVH